MHLIIDSVKPKDTKLNLIEFSYGYAQKRKIIPLLRDSIENLFTFKILLQQCKFDFKRCSSNICDLIVIVQIFLFLTCYFCYIGLNFSSSSS